VICCLALRLRDAVRLPEVVRSVPPHNHIFQLVRSPRLAIIRPLWLAPLALAAGTRLGVYEILTHLRQGGMGEVYHARDTKLGRDVTLKIRPRRS
jgi:hypothetical protein